jgi:integration host factor subunit beta
MGFGSFSVSYRQPRNGRNPKTGAKISIEGKKFVKFKGGNELSEMI